MTVLSPNADHWLLCRDPGPHEPWITRPDALLIRSVPLREPTQWGTHALVEYGATGRGGCQITQELFRGDPLTRIKEKYPDRTIQAATLLPGEYHPRLWRNGIRWAEETPRSHQRLPTDAVSGRRSCAVAVHRLLDQLASVIDVVALHPTNRQAHGPAMRQLLILACTEVEAGWRGILSTNLAADDLRIRYDSKDYVRLADPMRLREYRVVTARYKDDWGVIAPFRDWSPGAPTESLPWYHAYNGAKHNREREAPLASLDMVVAAVAAAWVLLVAQYGDDSDDFRDIEFHRAGFELEAVPQWTANELYFPPDERGFHVKLLF